MKEQQRGLSLLERTGWIWTKIVISRGKKGSIPEWDGFQNKHYRDQVQFQNGLERGPYIKVHPPYMTSNSRRANEGTINNTKDRRKKPSQGGRGYILGNRVWF